VENEFRSLDLCFFYEHDIQIVTTWFLCKRYSERLRISEIIIIVPYGIYTTYAEAASLKNEPDIQI
jgi:hypothetical protein